MSMAIEREQLVLWLHWQRPTTLVCNRYNRISWPVIGKALERRYYSKNLRFFSIHTGFTGLEAFSWQTVKFRTQNWSFFPFKCITDHGMRTQNLKKWLRCAAGKLEKWLRRAARQCSGAQPANYRHQIWKINCVKSTLYLDLKLVQPAQEMQTHLFCPKKEWSICLFWFYFR